MKTILLKNAVAILPDEKRENVSLLVENGRISEISTANKNYPAETVIDLENQTVYAGFIDIHNHGAVGVDVNDASAADLRRAGKFLAANGVTAWLPTFVPDADKTYEKVVSEMEAVRATQENDSAAQILGVHYEGVFANQKMCGALRPQFFKTFKNADEIKALPKLAGGVHLTTLAPEIENGVEIIGELVRQNWIVSIGHTCAGTKILDEAFNAGARHLTHFFNAMTGIHHRDLGVAGWALTNRDVTFDIIADGIHVAPEMLEFACRAKSAEKVSLISDSIAPTGLGDGNFEVWGEKVSVTGGRTENARGSIAGSVITMLDAVRTMLKLGFDEREVSRMASHNPARLLGIEKTRGTIEIGKRADLVALDEQGNVKLTLIGGGFWSKN